MSLRGLSYDKDPIDDNVDMKEPMGAGNHARKVCDKLSTFNKGSNIPGLSSDYILQTEGVPRPRLPSSRVRDLGKEILERANKATWFDDMIQGYQPERDNVCIKRKRVERKASTATAAEEEAKENPQQQQKQQQQQQQQPPAAREEEKKLEVGGDQEAAAPEVVVEGKTPASGGDSEDSLDKSIDLLKQLGEQQLQLMQKQKDLQEQIEMKQNDRKEAAALAKELEQVVEATPSPTVPLEEALNTLGSKKGQWQRRLKGNVAQLCAKRSEGSLKSIIWFQDNEQENNS